MLIQIDSKNIVNPEQISFIKIRPKSLIITFDNGHKITVNITFKDFEAIINKNFTRF